MMSRASLPAIFLAPWRLRRVRGRMHRRVSTSLGHMEDRPWLHRLARILGSGYSKALYCYYYWNVVADGIYTYADKNKGQNKKATTHQCGLYRNRKYT